jgi:Icc-related predicted phosphoesterase
MIYEIHYSGHPTVLEGYSDVNWIFDFEEAEWLRELLSDLLVVEKPILAILMNCDNQTVITKVNNAKDNAKSTRHVKRRLKTVRKLRNSGVITVSSIQTGKNLADPFTKGLSRNVIEIASREMGMRPM